MRRGKQTRRRSDAGYTMLETIFAAVIGVFFVGVSVGIIRSATGLADDDRQRTQLTSDHRRNFEHLTNMLRNADPVTLIGFDVGTKIAADLHFQRPTGSANGVRALGPVEWLVWRPSSRTVSGVNRPGNVMHITPAGERVAAARVPQGGFQVTRLGRTLSVQLTTYQPIAGVDALRVTSVSKVSVRN